MLLKMKSPLLKYNIKNNFTSFIIKTEGTQHREQCSTLSEEYHINLQ